MPTEMLTKEEHPAPAAVPPTVVPTDEDELRDAARAQATRVRRLRLNAALWLGGTIVITTLSVLNQWQDNGRFERFGNGGNAGDWSPTLWALTVGVWGLIVGIMALRVRFERPATAAEVDREVERLTPDAAAEGPPPGAELRRIARARLDRIGRLKFHVAAWVLGMLVLTPIWALIEWQDNGGFERWSNDSAPGDWEPWIVYVAGIWALAIAVLVLRARAGRPAWADGERQRRGSRP